MVPVVLHEVSGLSFGVDATVIDGVIIVRQVGFMMMRHLLRDGFINMGCI